MNGRNIPVLFAIGNDKNTRLILEEKGIRYLVNPPLSDFPKEINLLIFDIATKTADQQILLNEIKSRGAVTCQITDMGLNILACDLTIDGSLVPSQLLGEGHFCGPDFMILHHKIRHFHRLKRHYRSHPNHILITLGGGAQYRNIRNLVHLLHNHAYVCKIAPGFAIKKNQKKVLSRLYPSIGWVGKTESLARAYFEADLAIVTAGVSAYEAGATGTPALYLSYHELQKQTALAFQTNGLGCYIGPIKSYDPMFLLDTIKELDLSKRTAMGQAGKGLIDGKGLFRVNQVLNSSVL